MKLLACLIVCVGVAVTALAADPTKRVVIYDGLVSRVGAGFKESSDLWMTLKDVRRVTGFVLKPQGLCRDKLCFPIPKSRKNEFISKQSRTTWLNLSGMARLIKQPVAFDQTSSVWFFGPRPDEQDGYVASFMAPDFSLPDLSGRIRTLSEFRGKKVLLITWASW